MHNPFVYGESSDYRMAEMTIDDPDEYRNSVPVDDRGRVVIGKAYAGENVNVVIEVLEDE